MEAIKDRYNQHMAKEMETFASWPKELQEKAEAAMASEEFAKQKGELNAQYFAEADKNGDGMLNVEEW